MGHFHTYALQEVTLETVFEEFARLNKDSSDSTSRHIVTNAIERLVAAALVSFADTRSGGLPFL